MELHDLSEFFRLSAILNLQLSAKAAGSRNILLVILGRRKLPDAEKAVLMAKESLMDDIDMYELQAKAAKGEKLADWVGAQVDAVSASYMRVLVPFRNLRHLDTLPDIRLARLPIPAKTLGTTGLGTNVSESVALTGADELQLDGTTGTGIKVAVVDLGFIGLASAINAGELPANTVAVNLPGTNDNPIEAATEHGVGVAEHVMDMAPGASLYCIMVGDEVDLENAAAYLKEKNIRIANHSVGWVIASYYDDTGPINAIINQSHDTDGVFWTVAAGNDARRHWRGIWSDPNNNNLLNFTSTDELLDLTSSSRSVSLFLNWDQYGNSATDLDLYVLDRRNRVVAQSIGPQYGPQDPSEAVSFTYSSASAPYRIEVYHYSGPTAGLDITLFSFNNNLEYASPGSSLMDPADAHGAFSVAAIDQIDWSSNTPLPEPYSSQGPTNDGRPKPDIAAPDGTTSWTYGLRSSFGTSFSSPTVAGAAALLLAQSPTATPAELAALLAGMAVDIGASGPDYVFGAGKLALTTNTNNPPTVVITGLKNNDTVGGTTVQLNADAADDVGVARVDFAVDGNLVGSDTSEPYETLWDSTTVANGAHTITATAVDTGGLTAHNSVNVFVDNGNMPPVANAGPDQTVADSNGDGLATITLNGSASHDPDGSIVFYAWNEGATLLANTATATIELPVGTHTIMLTVTDNGGLNNTDTVVITVSVPPAAIVAFSDSFEAGEWNGLWTEDSQNDWYRSNQRAVNGSYSAEVDGRAQNAALISVPIDLQGRHKATITFSWFIESSLDTGEYLAFDVSTDGGATWTEKARLRGNVDQENTWHNVPPVVLTGINNLKIRFRGKMSASDEDADVDMVRVVAE